MLRIQNNCPYKITKRIRIQMPLIHNGWGKSERENERAQSTLSMAAVAAVPLLSPLGCARWEGQRCWCHQHLQWWHIDKCPWLFLRGVPEWIPKREISFQNRLGEAARTIDSTNSYQNPFHTSPSPPQAHGYQVSNWRVKSHKCSERQDQSWAAATKHPLASLHRGSQYLLFLQTFVFSSCDNKGWACAFLFVSVKWKKTK